MGNLRNKAYEWLRRSEAFFRADMVYIAHGGFWMSFGQFIGSGLSLVLVIVIANLLPKETYGQYRYILSLTGILNIFTLTRMNSAVAQAVATGNDGALITSVKYQVKWNLITVFVFWCLSAYYFLHNDALLGTSLLILSFFMPITDAFNTYGAYLNGKKQFRLNNIFSIITTAFYVGMMILAIYVSGTVISLVVVYAVTSFLSGLGFYLLTLHFFKPPAETADKGFLQYGRELTFIEFLSPIVSQIDKIIVSHFWGPAQLAVYALARAIPDRAVVAIKSWVGIISPKLATKTPQEINTVFYKRIFQGMSLGALATLAYVILAPYLFKYLLPQYLDAIAYSQILAISFIFAMPNRYLGFIYEAQKLSRVIFTNSITQNTIRISLYIILGASGGVMGLVIAEVLHNFISMLINIYMWRKASRSI